MTNVYPEIKEEEKSILPQQAVVLEFPFRAVPLAQLRNDGRCSIVFQLDWSSGDPGLHCLSVRKQSALHLLEIREVHEGLNPSSHHLALPPWPGSPLVSWSDFIEQTSGLLLRKNRVSPSGREIAALPSFEIWQLFDCLKLPLNYREGSYEECFGCSPDPWEAPWSWSGDSFFLNVTCGPNQNNSIDTSLHPLPSIQHT